MPSESHMEYAKLYGRPPVKEKIGFIGKIMHLVKNGKKDKRDDKKIYKYIDQSFSAFNATEQTKSIFLKEFKKYLTLNEDLINKTKLFNSYKKKSMRKYPVNFYTFRTPLEYAIERNAPLEVIMLLLEGGAEPSNTACSMAMLHLLSKKNTCLLTRGEDIMDFDKNKKIIELLSFAGADWSQPCGKFSDCVKNDHPSGNISSPLADFIVEKLGEEESYALGVAMQEHEKYEIDLDEFAKRIRHFRVKRSKKLMDNKNISIEDGVEILIPEKAKARWTSGG